MQIGPLVAVPALALLLGALAAPASAGELQALAGVSVRKSTWRGDWSGGPQLGAGYRFARVVAIDFLGWAEPASVDRRLNTGVTFGVTGTLPFEKVRPSLRAYLIHQHEEGFVSIREQPFGALLGIGAGIRHRAGFGGRLGAEVPFSRGQHAEWTLLGGVDATFFPETSYGGMSLGPSAYVGATFGIGVNYLLPGAP